MSSENIIQGQRDRVIAYLYVRVCCHELVRNSSQLYCSGFEVSQSYQDSEIYSLQKPSPYSGQKQHPIDYLGTLYRLTTVKI